MEDVIISYEEVAGPAFRINITDKDVYSLPFIYLSLVF
jgi:hypothetical protein